MASSYQIDLITKQGENESHMNNKSLNFIRKKWKSWKGDVVKLKLKNKMQFNSSNFNIFFLFRVEYFIKAMLIPFHRS